MSLIKSVKKAVGRALPAPVREFIVDWQNEATHRQWESRGRPVPVPHVVKQRAIARLRERYATPILVETGTYRGDMIEAQRKHFRRIYSIELGEELAAAARRRFAARPHVTILQGDSAERMGDVVPQLDDRALFWLDGHYSGGVTARGELECPIWGELDAIFADNAQGHVLIIDDARCFNGTHDYPTVDELRDYLARRAPNYELRVENDAILCLPT